MKLRPKFFLSTLLLLTLTIASGMLLWLHWKPWYFDDGWTMQQWGWDSDFHHFSPDKSYCVTINPELKLLQARDTVSGRELGRVTLPSVPEPLPMDPHWVYLGGLRQCWNFKTGALTPCFKDVKVNTAQKLPGIYCLLTCEYNTQIVWDLVQDRQLFLVPSGYQQVTISENGLYIAAKSRDMLEIWEASSGLPQTREKMILSPGSEFHFSPDGNFLAIHEEKSFRVIETKTQRICLEGTCPTRLRSAFTSDSRMFFTGSKYQELQFWDVPAGTPRFTIKTDDPNRTVYSIKLSPDSRKLYVLTGDPFSSNSHISVLRVMDAQTQEILWQQYIEHKDRYMEPLGRDLIFFDGKHITMLSNRRPEQWWGIFYLPELWLTAIFSIALLVNFYRNLNRAKIPGA